MVLLLLGCSPQLPPTQWPAEGCAATLTAAGRVGEHTWQLQVDDGVELAVAALQPTGDDCRGAVVLVPGGLQTGLQLLDGEQAPMLAEAGLMVVAFDPRGRGESEGVEDANGMRAQDDLAALLRWVASLDEVDPDQVVLFSRSFGAAMASGALARHSDLSPLSWLDYEGPGWLEDDIAYATDTSAQNLQAMAAAAADPAAWWDAREPAGWVGRITTPYWRLQGVPDHAQGSRLAHAEAMLNGATAAPEVVLNRHPVALPVSEEQIEQWVIEGGLEPHAFYATETVLELLGRAPAETQQLRSQRR